MKLETILKLIAKKYPANAENGWLGVILVMYDDESGLLRKTTDRAGEGRDYGRNSAYNFSNVQQLIDHLKENRNDTESS